MKLNFHRITGILIFIAGSCTPFQSAHAQFTNTDRDLTLTFRKTGSDGSGDIGSVVFEVDIGQASIYYGAAAGSTISISAYNKSNQLAKEFDSLNDLSWSVGGCVPNAGDTGDTSKPTRTLWVTQPRQDPTVQASPGWSRSSAFTQGQADSKIQSILDNARTWASTVAADPITNTPFAAAIPAGNVYNANGSLGGAGNYLGTFQGNVENTTPSLFTFGSSPSRSDFYELQPGGGQGAYLGYFELRTDGSMTFNAKPLVQTYPAVTLSVTTNASGAVLVSFPSTLNGTYLLHYTNIAGLTAPVTAWPTASGTIIGDGTVKTFQQNISGAGIFYSVSVH